MKTEKRLTIAYKNARVEYIDEHSKYVFFSDCHRGNGSHQDEFIKNRNIYLFALDQYYKDGFTLVEAGDGDELWEHPKFKVIKNAHYHVFQSMKRFYDEDRLIMLYGNHNNYLKDPRYVEKNYFTYYDDYRKKDFDFLKGLKACEALLLKNRQTGQEILTIHGHQGDFANDQFWIFTMLSVKYFWRHLHAFGVKNPASPVKNVHKRHKIEKNFSKWILKHETMLICGHTHRYKYPREGEPPYFNTGCCIYPTTVTGIEIISGMIQLVRWKTSYNEDGLLRIQKEVLRGPDRLGKFDIRI
jgi:UDP-2,3-diacylglucosamine pyrophosphatase LpxH